MSGKLRATIFQATLVGSFLVSACLGKAPVEAQTSKTVPINNIDTGWKYSELRQLDEADAPMPRQDLIAAYIRLRRSNENIYRIFTQRYQEIELRVDFLDIDYTSMCDLYIALDHRPGGVNSLPDGQATQIEWDSLVVIDASGQIISLDASGQPNLDMAIRILRNPLLDYITIKLSGDRLISSLGKLRLQLFTTPPGQTEISDRIPPFHALDPPPPSAKLLFTFWNSFPASSPVQALRRWDGAHTGPFGGRHGLFNLLRTARNHQIPLALIDLKYPTALSALDYARGLELVQDMQLEGLLILPDVMPDIPFQSLPSLPDATYTKAANYSRQVGLQFGIPGSQFLLATSTDYLPPGYLVAFLRSDENYSEIITPFRLRDKLILPITGAPHTIQATTEGLTLDMRKTLLNAALASGKHPEIIQIVHLGGSLPESEWGVPQISRSAFLYITKHPWMRVLSAYDLISMNQERSFRSDSETETAEQGASAQLIRSVASKLVYLPDSNLQHSAWQAFYSLYSPVFPDVETTDALRLQYVGQINALLTAGIWEISPNQTSSCTEDIDLDGQSECLLISPEVFAVIELDSGALTYLFVRKSDEVIQVIAPTSQFNVGLGDPASWNLTGGLSADPQVIPGAFADELGPYTYIIQDGRLILMGQGIQKTYQISSLGIQIEILSSQPLTAHIPVSIDPEMRFRQGWVDQVSWEDGENQAVWHLSRGYQLKVESDAWMSVSDFTETRQLMGGQEDPNRDYPAGHFLPFPVGLVTINSEGSLSAAITLNP